MSIEKAREALARTDYALARANDVDALRALATAVHSLARTEYHTAADALNKATDAEISRASAGGGDVPVCYDCGLAYDDPGFCDLVVLDDVWRQISPTGDEGGILCPTCMCRAARRAGLDKVTAAFRSGPFAPAQPAPAAEGGEPVVIGYTNHRGEFAERRIHPMNIWYGSTRWHSEPQWFLGALDYDKGEHRDFALKDIVSRTATARIRELEGERDVAIIDLRNAREGAIIASALQPGEYKELAEARDELHCCDDVPLDQGLASGIAALRYQRDQLIEWNGQNAVRAERAEERAEAAEASLAALRERVNRAVSVLNITRCDETDRAQDIRVALALLTDPAPATAQPARGDDSPVPADYVTDTEFYLGGIRYQPGAYKITRIRDEEPSDAEF